MKLPAAVAICVLSVCAAVTSGDAIVPVFDPANFMAGAPIDNPYLPLIPGTIYRYRGEVPGEDGEDPEVETVRVHVTDQTIDIWGVQATVVRDTGWVDGVLEEDTFDYYAQDKSGNVWYMGEFSTAFEYNDDGDLIGTNNEGSWKAGENGALPGYIMEANPMVGDEYYQEFAELDEAVDQAEVTSLMRSVSTILGDFDDALETLEFTMLDLDILENKIYVAGIGLVLIEEELDEEGEPTFILELKGIGVPSPAAGAAGIMGMGFVAMMRRRRPARW